MTPKYGESPLNQNVNMTLEELISDYNDRINIGHFTLFPDGFEN